MQDLQSIEDLLSTSANNDESVQSKFIQKTQEIKLKELEQIAMQQAVSSNLPYINLIDFPISPEAIQLISEQEAKNLFLICFYYDGNNIRLAAAKQPNQQIQNKLEELEKKYHCPSKLYFTSMHSFERALQIYKTVPKIREIIQLIKINEEDLNKYSAQFSSFQDLQNYINSAEDITAKITMMLAAAIQSECSDIHVEAELKDIRVRFRIDGMLHDAAVLDKELWKKIISRLKILAKVKINISDKPQDGRISINTKKEQIDIRASFLPTNYGESVVMRLLKSSTVGLKFEDLGISSVMFKLLKHEIERPNGMIITTGPTGSGKTTTLYSILKKLNKPETKIITIEDPIEYQLEGINQSQVGKNYTFAKALRSIVRQDPDVIMVGEIRDLETAETAIQAALTGHMVLSTIHTNDAVGAIPRFLSIGVKSFLLAPAINAIIGQRLIRKLCEKCKQKSDLEQDLKQRVMEILKKLPEDYKQNIDFNNLKFYKSIGCPVCQALGYKGRVGIFEIIITNPELEKLILSTQISEYDIREHIKKNKILTMVQDGLLKAINGITSVEEVFRVAE